MHNMQNNMRPQMSNNINVDKMMMAFNNMNNNMNNNQVFNPNKLDKSTKRSLIARNISEARIGMHKMCAKCDSTVVRYVAANPGKATSICQVKVIYEHALDVAEHYADVGVNSFTKKNKMNPVVLNVVSKEFTGDNFESNEDMRDDMMNIRTTYCVNPIKNNTYPIQNYNCVHTNYVHVIRSKNPKNLSNLNQIFRVGFITTSPIQQDGLVKKLSANDFTATCAIFENVFQTAMVHDHAVLILTPFGHEDDNNPIEDIIKLYNCCIMKYGHKFHTIIVAIPPYYDKSIYDVYAQNIVKPNEMFGEIDIKYDNLIIQKKIQEKLAKQTKPRFDSDNSDDDSNNNNNSNNSNNSNNNNGNNGNNNVMLQQLIMKMMKENPNMMQTMMNNNK